MGHDTEWEMGTGGRGRGRKALPVDPSSAVHSAYGTTGPEEDIVDAEIVDEPDGQDASSGQRERLRDRARGFFGAKTRERTEGRERQRDRDRERAASGDEGLDDRERLLKLRAETRLAGEAYMQTLRDSKLLVPGFNDEERAKEFDAMHAVYMQMMMQSCLRPLTRGVNPNSVIQAAGMMMAMRMLSPDFRKEMDSYLQPFKDKVQDRIDAKTRRIGERAERQAALAGDLVGGGAPETKEVVGNDEGKQSGKSGGRWGTSRDDFLSRRWRTRLEDLERRERGNRELFTPESAAMTEVALMENAFWKMRDPEQDAKQINASYKALRKRLRQQVEDDGLDRAEVVKRARTIIGERMESEPELRLMFNGVAHGRIVKAPPHEARLAGTDRVREVWTGEFDDHLGRRIPDEGMFTLRLPMEPDEHQVQLGETMKAAMLDGVQRGDRQALGGSVMGYMLGFAAKKQGLDTRGLPEDLQQRLDQSESMLASMYIDGLSDEEQQRVYSNAYVDAIEELNKEDPDFEHELKLALGEDWQDTMRAAVDDPATFLASQRTRPQPFRQGPGASARTGPEDQWSRDRGAEDYQPA
ncbi:MULTISPECIES: hypothetical protein [Paenarthrobacter]|uniref:Uncharacterized protein n=1 Tax=Paenarthrobacter ureafaciens TaxID=37931 RepID=A0AAX3ED31_PAEUR|nr:MULTISPECIES: hypothetical protein [Paenarthrobacter]NKR13334.1 hypothetical protein [Arthrobacter sp. M5]NKR14816.1 hypothetical protein [Arthrobacter sp. M6]OEH62370.1 hypothetical protein A5N13_01550 [Arthrobacter sp. D4]OEH62941.1 hypothetical protein A5N17_09790 [Arthrobacter sp. D2]MDO5865114.1 hypothetical protein [Paenarthrobacter sp. SD-2]